MGEVVTFPVRHRQIDSNEIQASLVGGRLNGIEFRNLCLRSEKGSVDLVTRTANTPTPHELMVTRKEADGSWGSKIMYLDDAALKELVEHGQRYFALKAERYMEFGDEASQG